MSEHAWFIKAAHAYTSQGSSPAGVWASAASFQAAVQTEPGLSQYVEDQALPSLTCPADGDFQPNDLLRSQTLVARLLADWPEHPPGGDVTLALTLCRPGEGYRGTQQPEKIRAGLVAALRIEKALDWADWCAAATLVGIDSPADWQGLGQSSGAATRAEVLWLSADSLINPGVLERLGDRVSNETFTDGLVLGEGAAALWLQATPDTPNNALAKLTVHGHSLTELNAEHSSLSGIDPHRDGLVNHGHTDPKSQSRWYGWLNGYPQARGFIEPQHTWLTAGVGYLGSAGWSLGILAALGRLPMPCPPIERVQVLHQLPAGHWFLATLETANPSPRTADSSATGHHATSAKGTLS